MCAPDPEGDAGGGNVVAPLTHSVPPTVPVTVVATIAEATVADRELLPGTRTMLSGVPPV